MAGNQILTISMITRESLRVLRNNCVASNYVNREYDEQFAISGAKIGDTLNVRKPARYIGRSGPVLKVEAQTETFDPLVLSNQDGVDIELTTKDMTLSMDDFSKRFLEPALANVANKIDRAILLKALGVYQSVGTPGVTPNTLAIFLAAKAKLDFAAAPRDKMRTILLDPNAEAGIINNLTTLFNPSKEISAQYLEGEMGRAIGSRWNMDQNIISIVNGTHGGSPQVASNASQGGSSIATSGWTASQTVLSKGEVFTVSGVFSVNPQSRQSTGQLQQFVCLADVVSDGSGLATISVAPAMNSTGQFQNMSALPLSGATISLSGAGSATQILNLNFHRDAFILGMADLMMPKGVHAAARVSDKETGFSIRMVQAYDIVNDMMPCRLDVLYGVSAPYPELACRISG